MKCAFCNTNLSDKVKHLTFHSYKVTGKDACMCAKCAKLDLETAHARYNSKRVGEEVQQRIRQEEVVPIVDELSRFHRLFGNIYFKT